MIDINTPVTNPDLLSALKDTSSSQENRLERIVAEAKKAHFLAPVSISLEHANDKSSREIVLEKDTTIRFNLIKNAMNQEFFVVFTDWNALRKWRNVENQQTLIVTFEDMSSMVLNSKDCHEGFVINPFGEDFVFTKQLIQALMQEQNNPTIGNADEVVVRKDTEVLLGQPRIYPKDLIESIIKVLKKQKKVKAAYFMQMLREKEISYLIVVDFSGDKKELFDDIAICARPYLNGMYIDLMPLESGFAQNAIRNLKPFYIRSWFGIF